MEFIYIILAAIIFTTFEPVAKSLGGTINPFALTMLRFLIGGLVLMPLAIVKINKDKIKLKIRDVITFVSLGILCIVFSMTLLQFGLKYTAASSSAVVFSSNPVFTVIFAHFLLKEKLNIKKVIALSISFIGVLCTINLSNGLTGTLGILIVLVSAISFSLYTVLNKRLLGHLPGVINNAFVFTLGSLIVLIPLLIGGVDIVGGVNQTNILQLLYLGVVVSGFGYIFYFAAMKKGGAKAAATVFLIKPVLVPLFAFVLINENVSYMTFIGIFLVVTGSIIMRISKK